MQKEEKRGRGTEEEKKENGKDKCYLKIKDIIEIYVTCTKTICIASVFLVFLFVFSFLRSLRNLRALCVQKIPFFTLE